MAFFLMQTIIMLLSICFPRIHLLHIPCPPCSCLITTLVHKRFSLKTLPNSSPSPVSNRQATLLSMSILFSASVCWCFMYFFACNCSRRSLRGLHCCQSDRLVSLLVFIYLLPKINSNAEQAFFITVEIEIK